MKTTDDVNPQSGIASPDYELRYLPLALQDLDAIFRYIVFTLKAPQAATDLLAKIDAMVNELAYTPYTHRIYPLSKLVKNEYRKLPVQNYSVFYVVKENLVEIHRVLYAKRDFELLLK
jgi:plasmid stabilization system protein ParE